MWRSTSGRCVVSENRDAEVNISQVAMGDNRDAEVNISKVVVCENRLWKLTSVRSWEVRTDCGS